MGAVARGGTYEPKPIKGFPCWCQHGPSAHDYYHPARMQKVCKQCPDKIILVSEFPKRITKYLSIKLNNSFMHVNWRSHEYIPMDNLKYVEFINDRAKRRTKNTRRKNKS